MVVSSGDLKIYPDLEKMTGSGENLGLGLGLSHKFLLLSYSSSSSQWDLFSGTRAWSLVRQIRR